MILKFYLLGSPSQAPLTLLFDGLIQVRGKGCREGDDSMKRGLTLRQHMDQYAGKDPLRLVVAGAIEALAQALIDIADLTCRGALAGITGQEHGRNTDGDIQKDMDIRADHLIRTTLKSIPVAAFASEEAAAPEIWFSARSNYRS